MAESNKPNLVLIRGGAQSLGPVSRLGLWDRFPTEPKAPLYLFLCAKLILLTAIAYYLWG